MSSPILRLPSIPNNFPSSLSRMQMLSSRPTISISPPTAACMEKARRMKTNREEMDNREMNGGSEVGGKQQYLAIERSGIYKSKNMTSNLVAFSISSCEISSGSQNISLYRSISTSVGNSLELQKKMKQYSETVSFFI